MKENFRIFLKKCYVWSLIASTVNWRVNWLVCALPSKYTFEANTFLSIIFQNVIQNIKKANNKSKTYSSDNKRDNSMLANKSTATISSRVMRSKSRTNLSASTGTTETLSLSVSVCALTSTIYVFIMQHFWRKFF